MIREYWKHDGPYLDMPEGGKWQTVSVMIEGRWGASICVDSLGKYPPFLVVNGQKFVPEAMPE